MLIRQKEAELAQVNDEQRASVVKHLDQLRGRVKWMEQTIIGIIISEAQNEVADFKKWGFDIIPHRTLVKQGFEVGNTRIDVRLPSRTPTILSVLRLSVRCGSQDST